MKKPANDLKEKNAEETHVPDLYFHQQYHSPCCARKVKQALNAYEKLTTKKDKFKFVKEKIHIRYLGLGWVDPYHPWSKNKHTYQQAELLQHLINVIIPLTDNEIVPSKAPVNPPTRPDTFTLGTKLANLVARDNSMLAREKCVRLNAMIERDRLEDSGYGYQLMEMQENSWPLERIRNGTFGNIDMCFEMTDVGETILQW